MSPIAVVAVLTTGLVAQKVTLGEGRIAQVFDVADLLDGNKEQPRPELANVGREQRFAGTHADLQGLVDFLRVFASPSLTTGEDLQPLGQEHLVALGGPEKVGAIEALLAMAKADRANQYYCSLRICHVPQKAFEQELAKLMPADAGAAADAPRTCLLATEVVNALLRPLKQHEGVKIVQAPQIVAPTLRTARFAIGTTFAYVRDFTIELVPGEAELRARPVTDAIFNGTRAEVICAELPDGSVGCSMKFEEQVLETPVREVEISVPGTTLPARVQVPRVHGCRAAQAVAMTPDTTALMAARKGDGMWVVTMLTITKVRTSRQGAGK